jgi:outer membrane protein assembly factor BamB
MAATSRKVKAVARKLSLAAALALLCTLGFVSCRKPAASDSSGGVPVISKKWEFTLGGKITGGLALAGDGTLYAACEDGFVYALDPAGTLQWKTYIGPTEATPAVGPDGAIYVSNNHGRFLALNHSGSIRWTIDSYEGSTFNKNAGALGRDYLYGVSRGNLSAVRLDNGQIAWQSAWGGDQWGSVTLLPDSTLLSPGRAKLTALDANGQVIWQYPAVSTGASPSFFISSGIAIDNNRTLYATANRSSLVAMGLDGSVKWELKTTASEMGRSTPVISIDGTIFFGGADATLYALDALGTTKWKFPLAGPVRATPMLAQDGSVFVVAGHNLSAISPDGRLVSQADMGRDTESSPTLAPDGTVYVATTYNSKILAYAGGHGGLMNSPWPKNQADVSNSGTPHLF